jgi:serine phosphatase RsbU (regulator of sigma subunit)
VGDATGKGVPAALVMSITCGMLRLAAQSYSSPGVMLQRVNEALCPNIPANMFVTSFYAVLDPESGLLRYANAGHDLPYLHHDGDAEELTHMGEDHPTPDSHNEDAHDEHCDEPNPE